MLSIATDYAADAGRPDEYLKKISEAGFSHIHWCHHWGSDFVYSKYEIAQIKAWLSDFGLELLDLHSPLGKEKRWVSEREYERLSGVDLVKNRIEMTAELGGDVIVMHYGGTPENEAERPAHFARLYKSLGEVEDFAKSHGIKIALENGRVSIIAGILKDFSPDFLGICYDSGHSNMKGEIEELVAVKDRLIAMHLHDNDGVDDQHKPLFSGTINWPRLAEIIAQSSYRKCINMELGIRNADTKDEEAFLREAFEQGTKFSKMVDSARG